MLSPSLIQLMYFTYRWLYWRSMRGIERASMDGINRTVVIDVENVTRSTYSFDPAIFSFTLDYKAQVFYWVFGDESDYYLTLISSNVDGTNQQTILRFGDQYIDYYSLLYYYPPGLTVHEETLLLSLSGMNVVYSINLELGANNDNFTTFLNGSESVLCRYDYYQLKVTKQPAGNNYG